jgi:signal transduction histidine kinase
LSLARRAVRLLGGAILFGEGAAGGLAVSVELPAQAPQA